MAVLTDADRLAVWKEYMQIISRSRTVVDLTKPELRAFLDATDTWISDNAGPYNATIPQPARAELTATLKSQGFNLIAEKRFQKGV